NARTLAGGGKRSLRPVGAGRAGAVRRMGLLPFARLVIVLRRGNVGTVVHPAVPARRDRRGLGVTVVDHPAARNAEGRVRPLVIDVAELVLTDLLAEAPGKDAGADGLS